MHIFSKRHLDTGTTDCDLQIDGRVRLDLTDAEFEFKAGEIKQLRWTTGTDRDHKVSKLWLLRYWVTPFGIRKIRLQFHLISPEGRFGRRNIVMERHNGKIVRS